MTELSNDTLRQFPYYGDRRNDGTNVEEANSFEPSLDYVDNIPLETDIRIDLSQHMNCLHIRGWEDSDLTGTTARPTDFGLGHSREEFEQVSNDGLVTRGDNPADLEHGLAGFNPCQLRTMGQIGVAATSGVTGAMATTLGNWFVPALPTGAIHRDNPGGGFLFAHPAMGGVAGATADGLGTYGLFAGQATNWRGTSGLIPAKNLIQLMLTGSVNVSSYEIADVMSLVISDMGTDCENLFDATRPGNGGTAPGLQANLNYIAQTMIYTSAADFVMDWYDAVENLCLNLRYFNNEFIGFFERGFKSHFWQKFSNRELMLLCWLTQIGMAKRRGKWQRNLHPISQSVCTGTGAGDSQALAAEQVFGGVFNPFYMRIDDIDYATGTTVAGAKTELQAPWLLKYIDEMTYETHSYDEPIRGIYQEDLLTGLDIILEECSRELGMGWRSIGRGYMEFFSDFKTGEVPDLRSEEARTNNESLRTAWHLGFNNVTDVSNSMGTESDTVAHTSWWQEFVTRGGIIETDRRGRLIQDVQDLSNMEFLTGSKFSAGMQQGGISKTKLYHRDDINGNEHTVDLTLDPECKMQLVNFKIGYPDLSTAGDAAGTIIHMDSSAWPEVASWPKKNRICVAWVSSAQGWHVYAQNMIHPLNHIVPGPWVEGAGNLNDNLRNVGYGRGYSHICYPDGSLVNPARYNSTGNAPATFNVTIGNNVHVMAPMFGEMYYDIAPDGWFPSLMKFMSRLYTRWSETQAASPWQSKWSGSAISGVNLISMLSMSTGEALVQSNLKSLLHSAYCGINPDNLWSLETRLHDRQLHNPAIHVRPSRRQIEQVGMDAVAVLLPDGMDRTQWLEGQLMLNVLMYLTGRLNSLDNIAVPTETYYGRSRNNFGNHGTNHIDFYGDVYSYSTATADRYGSNVRTIFHGDKLLNNVVLDHNITRLALVTNTAAGTAANRQLPLCATYVSSMPQSTLPTGVAELFDWYDEEVVTNSFNLVNAAHCVPGMRQWYMPFVTLNPNTVTGANNSPCSLFGLTQVLAGAGSLTPLDGRATWSYEVVTVVNQFRAMLQLPERPQLVGGTDVTTWDSDLWIEYCSYRRGVEHGQTDALNALQVETLLFKKTPFKVLMIDQDVFDQFLGYHEALQFINHRQVKTHSTASAVLDRDFNVDYQGLNMSSGSGGGVVSGSGFDKSDIDTSDSVEEL